MRTRLATWTTVGLLLGLGALPGRAALASGVYQTLPGATVLEWGDRVPNGQRVMPLFATVTLDLNAAQPSLLAVITNAVLEGGEPFALTVRSASSLQLPGGTNRFMGDYLRELQPTGTQYVFDWKFSANTNGHAVWNGMNAWAGGHAWYVNISNVTLVPLPTLETRRAGGQVIVAWPDSFTGYQLEQAVNLPATQWSPVTNAVMLANGRHVVTLEPSAPAAFLRLHKP